MSEIFIIVQDGGCEGKSATIQAFSILSEAEAVAELSEIVELNIGHFLIGEAIFDGLGVAVRKMRAAMDRGRAQAGKIAPGTMP